MPITENPIFRKLLRGGAIGLVIKVGSGLLAFAIALVMARALGAEEYGKFAALLSAGLAVGQFATFGQPKLVVRFFGEYMSRNEPGLARGLLRHSHRIVFFGSMALAALLTAVVAFGVTRAGGEGYSHWLVVGPLILGLALAEYYSHVLRSFHELVWAMLPRDILWRGFVTLFGLGLAALGLHFTAATIISVSAVVLLVLMLLQFRRVSGHIAALSAGAPAYRRRDWYHATWGLWGLNVLGVAFPHITVVSVSFLMGDVEAGSFFAAVRIVGLLSMPLIAINLVMGPGIASAYHAENAVKNVQDICRTSVILLLPVVLAAALAVWVLGEMLLGLVSDAAAAARSALLILTAGYVVNTLSGSTGLLMQMTGHERRFLAYSAVSNAVAVVLLFVLVPLAGLAGAAVCVVIATCGWNIAVVIWARREIGIDPSVAVLILGAPVRKTMEMQP